MDSDLSDLVILIPAALPTATRAPRDHPRHEQRTRHGAERAVTVMGGGARRRGDSGDEGDTGVRTGGGDSAHALSRARWLTTLRAEADD